MEKVVKDNSGVTEDSITSVDSTTSESVSEISEGGVITPDDSDSSSVSSSGDTSRVSGAWFVLGEDAE